MRPSFAAILVACLAASSCASTPGAPIAVPPIAARAPAIWPLRGTPLGGGDAQRRPVVAKVANDPAARPQAGLGKADVVLELPVEGGLTRYALVFQSQDAAHVGPMRSARQSDLNYLSTLHAILAHVGASEQVTAQVRDAARRGGFVDVDELEHPEAFDRVSTRVPPYNAYTSTDRIRTGAGAGRASVPALAFDGAESGRAAEATGPGTALTVPYAEPVRYTYEAAAGAPSVDFRATGSGTVVLRDGKRYDGTWTRQGDDMYRFRDRSGATIALKPGLTWIHIVPEQFDLGR